MIKATQKKHQPSHVQLQIQYKNKGISSYKRHNKNTQSPFPLYVAVKLYSSSRSKSPLNWLYFCAGISLPYISLVKLIRDIANRMISQYNRDGAFLARTLRKGILTIISKDNTDQNSKSTTAARHWHGTYIFQFPTEENPGIAIEYGDLENSSNRSSYKFLLHHFRPPQTAIIETEYQKKQHGLRQLVQLFGLHGLDTIPRGVIIQENLTFQQFFP